MKMKRILVTAIMVIALATAAYAGGLTTEEQNFQRAFESFRVKYRLKLPDLDTSLANGSRDWSARMRQTGRFYHGASSENIYRGSESGLQAFRAWERSPGHRALLASPNLESFGVGNDGQFWTFRARMRSVERDVVRETHPVIVTQSWEPSVVRSPKHFKHLKSLLRCCCCR